MPKPAADDEQGGHGIMFPGRSSPHQVYSGFNASLCRLMCRVGKAEINDDQVKNRMSRQVVDGIVIGARDYWRSDKQTFVGEIVDSKCFLGVMNPGQLAPHRACAIRCISGGAPPVLLVRQKDGSAICLLLVSADGKPVNKQVLDKVAEPVEITGEVERQGEMLVLRSDPLTYRRVGR